MTALEVSPYWLIPMAAVCIFVVQYTIKLFTQLNHYRRLPDTCQTPPTSRQLPLPHAASHARTLHCVPLRAQWLTSSTPLLSCPAAAISPEEYRTFRLVSKVLATPLFHPPTPLHPTPPLTLPSSSFLSHTPTLLPCPPPSVRCCR